MATTPKLVITHPAVPGGPFPAKFSPVWRHTNLKWWFGKYNANNEIAPMDIERINNLNAFFYPYPDSDLIVSWRWITDHSAPTEFSDSLYIGHPLCGMYWQAANEKSHNCALFCKCSAIFSTMKKAQLRYVVFYPAQLSIFRDLHAAHESQNMGMNFPCMITAPWWKHDTTTPPKESPPPPPAPRCVCDKCVPATVASSSVPPSSDPPALPSPKVLVPSVKVILPELGTATSAPTLTSPPSQDFEDVMKQFFKVMIPLLEKLSQ